VSWKIVDDDDVPAMQRRGQTPFDIGEEGGSVHRSVDHKGGNELFGPNDISKTAFRALYAQKEKIEKEFGEPLVWQELPGKKAIRIGVFKHGVDPSDKKQSPELHAWMLAKMDRIKKVFAGRVKTLPAEPTATTDDGEEPPEQ
jgi:Domain of unknown function (DUF4268)